jgi:carbon monoxide dehydrogenase subunit G
MGLHTSGEILVDVPRSAAFTFLEDPQRLASCIPGCRDVRELAPGRYSAVLSSRVALVTVTFNVTIDIVKIDPPAAIEATIAGDAVGLAGHVAAKAAVQLADEAGQCTRIGYTADIALTGRLGGLGQPVFRAASAQLARQFGENLKRAIETQRTETPA